MPSSTLSACVEQMATAAPASISRVAIARPIPLDPPVTRAVFPLRFSTMEIAWHARADKVVKLYSWVPKYLNRPGREEPVWKALRA